MSEASAYSQATAPPEMAGETGPHSIRVLISDDHPLVREGLRRLLSLESDLEIVGEAADGESTVALVEKLDPDVVLLDLRMPGLDGFGALQRIQKLSKRPKVIVLTASEDKNEFVQAMKMGCSGIVLKQTVVGTHRQEYPEGPRRGDLAGLPHHGRRDATVRGSLRWRGA